MYTPILKYHESTHKSPEMFKVRLHGHPKFSQGTLSLCCKQLPCALAVLLCTLHEDAVLLPGLHADAIFIWHVSVQKYQQEDALSLMHTAGEWRHRCPLSHCTKMLCFCSAGCGKNVLLFTETRIIQKRQKALLSNKTCPPAIPSDV